MSAWYSIDVKGTVTKRGTDEPTLEELQEVVGGYVELIRLPSGNQLWVNEEGMLLNLPENHAATALLWDCSPAHVGQRIVGTAVMEYTDKEGDAEEMRNHIHQYDETVDIIDLTTRDLPSGWME